MGREKKRKTSKKQTEIKMGHIYCGLLLISIGLILVGIKASSTAQSILFSFAINLLTSLIIIFSVDFNLEKKTKQAAERQAKETELRQIKSCHRIIKPMLAIYTLEFNQLTIPVDARTENGRYLPIEHEAINSDFKLTDLRDVLSNDITVYGKFGNSALETYNVIYQKTVDAFSNMLSLCEYKYYPEIEEAVSDIVKFSNVPNSIDTLCTFQHNASVVQTLNGMLDSYEGNPDDDLNENKYSGNIFIHYLLLYRHLTGMREAVSRYCSVMNALNGGAESEIHI